MGRLFAVFAILGLWAAAAASPAARGNMPPPPAPLPLVMDVSAIKPLPVLDNGRVKPFDTVAREFARVVTGRERFGVVEGEGAAQRVAVRMEPAALVLDWAVRPAAWE